MLQCSVMVVVMVVVVVVVMLVVRLSSSPNERWDIQSSLMYPNWTTIYGGIGNAAMQCNGGGGGSMLVVRLSSSLNERW